jgi:hypothetical protein
MMLMNKVRQQYWIRERMQHQELEGQMLLVLRNGDQQGPVQIARIHLEHYLPVNIA